MDHAPWEGGFDLKEDCTWINSVLKSKYCTGLSTAVIKFGAWR